VGEVLIGHRAVFHGQPQHEGPIGNRFQGLGDLGIVAVQIRVALHERVQAERSHGLQGRTGAEHDGQPFMNVVHEGNLAAPGTLSSV